MATAPETTTTTKTATAEQSKPGEQSAGYKDRPWIPRFWDGIIAWGWYPLLWRNRFQVAPRRWGMAVLISVFSLFNFMLWVIQTALLGRRIARTELADDPIFVIGHWRSGTTLLHELLVLDPRHTYPDTYDCFAPNHFLISGWFLRPTMGILMPKQRPMDNMAAGWKHPQEDEFALCNMGVPSPYFSIAFPNHPPQNQEYFDLEQVSPEGRARWKRGLLWLLKCLTWREPKRVILKSPPHTFRVKILLEMFPKARFVHIVRNPYALFPSTVNLWKRLYRDEGLQVPHCEGLEEHVFETLNRMYDRFEQDRQLIPPGQFSEVRYEDLVADPMGQMESVYRQLGLGEFEQVRPALEAYFAEKADYQTNKFKLAPEMQAEVARRWKGYFQRYGYSEDV